MRKKWKGDYVEDSTRGRAVMNPKKYKGDALVQIWVDSRKLAMLSRWFDDNGWVTRHLSDVPKFAVEVLIDNLLDQGKIDRIEFTSDARDILERKYESNLNPSERGRKNVLHNLVLDDRRKRIMEGGDYPEERTSEPADSDLVRQARATYKKLTGKEVGELPAIDELGEKQAKKDREQVDALARMNDEV